MSEATIDTASATASLPNEIDPREFDGPEFQRDPFSLYKRLRDHHPVFHDRFHNRWIISRYWDVDWCFQHNDLFRFDIPQFRSPDTAVGDSR